MAIQLLKLFNNFNRITDMKSTYFFILLILCLDSLRAQVQTNDITASLVNQGSNTFSVVFTPNSNLSGIGNPLNVYVKIPISQASDTSISLLSNPYGLNFIASFDVPAEGYQYYYFQSLNAIELFGWTAGSANTIASFTTDGAISTIELSGGDLGGPIFTGSGYFWPGTSLASNNTGTNLVGWPISSVSSFPVELTSFEAEAQESFRTLLTWETASELNNDYFLLERSHNGTDFVSIAKIDGKGTSNIPHSYQYLDASPSIGTNYYRLQQVDVDGSFHYSHMVHVSFSEDVYSMAPLVYPNPATNTLFIRSVSTKEFWLDLYDVAGRQLQHVYNPEQIDVSQLSSGIYVLKCIRTDGTGESVQRIQILR